VDLPPLLAAQYLRHAFDQVLAVADALGDERLDDRPAGPRTNAVGALVLHCCAVSEFWLGHVALGRPSARDRAAEFARTATAQECHKAVAAALAQAESDLERIQAGEGAPHPERRLLPGGGGTDAAVLMHVLEELYQHLGQMELTRDVLLALRTATPTPDPPPTARPPTLTGRLVRLEPLETVHAPGLAAAAARGRDSYGFTSVPDGPIKTEAYVAELLDAAGRGDVVPFAQVRSSDDVVVGCTRLLELRYLGGETTPYAVEIGGTWLAGDAQRTGINAEAKLLLLGYAFEVIGVARVDFRTDARNARSRAAIAGIGAILEGVIRSSQPSRVPGEQGELRDSAVFSVVCAEWPAARAALTARLGRDR